VLQGLTLLGGGGGCQWFKYQHWIDLVGGWATDITFAMISFQSSVVHSSPIDKKMNDE
jgi:hypothetical protein